MARLALVVAVLIVLAAVVAAGVAVGVRIGRARQRRVQDAIDPQTYHELADFARAVLGPPANIDDIVIIPDHLKAQGRPLLRKISPRRRAAG